MQCMHMQARMGRCKLCQPCRRVQVPPLPEPAPEDYVPPMGIDGQPGLALARQVGSASNAGASSVEREAGCPCAQPSAHAR